MGRRLSVVFAASFLPNLLVFAIGVAAAIYYMRSGRAGIGLSALVLTCVLFDWWLLARYVQASEAPELQLPALALQAVALGTAALLAWQLWRRRYSATARARTQHFGQGMSQFLQNDYAGARATFTRLVRSDPWDVAAWIALGDALARDNKRPQSVRCYRRAHAVDTAGAYADLLSLRRGRPRAG